jgi:hypothetical protein
MGSLNWGWFENPYEDPYGNDPTPPSDCGKWSSKFNRCAGSKDPSKDKCPCGSSMSSKVDYDPAGTGSAGWSAGEDGTDPFDPSKKNCCLNYFCKKNLPSPKLSYKPPCPGEKAA